MHTIMAQENEVQQLIDELRENTLPIGEWNCFK